MLDERTGSLETLLTCEFCLRWEGSHHHHHQVAEESSIIAESSLGGEAVLSNPRTMRNNNICESLETRTEERENVAWSLKTLLSVCIGTHWRAAGNVCRFGEIREDI